MAVDDIYTKALLHFNGTDGSTTLTDESGKVWTAVGNAQIDTAQSVFGGASLILDGTGDYVTTPDSADWYLSDGSDSNSWTIDFRLRFNGDPGTGLQGLLSQYVSNSDAWYFYFNNNTLVLQANSGGTQIIGLNNAWNPASATWYHIALVKNGVSGYMMFVDGTQIGTTQIDTSPLPNIASVLRIGLYTTASNLNGWMDELRISKGVARWTANFTPPTSQYSPPTGGFFSFF